jgi:hypothetical protein
MVSIYRHRIIDSDDEDDEKDEKNQNKNNDKDGKNNDKDGKNKDENKGKKQYKRQKVDIITNLTLSTISGNGELENLIIDEKTDVSSMKCNGRIVMITSNHNAKIKGWYKILYNKYKQVKTLKKVDKGRKQVGCGKDMNPSITFTMLSLKYKLSDVHEIDELPKVYPIKVFRNGVIQIPGILDENMTDIKPLINELCVYLSEFYDREVKLKSIKSSMENYQCKLALPRLNINVNKLYSIVCGYQNSIEHIKTYRNILSAMPIDKKFHSNILQLTAQNPISLYEINYNTSKIVSLQLLFNRTRRLELGYKQKKSIKTTSVRITPEGTINIDGCNCKKDAEDIRKWIQKVIIEYKDSILLAKDTILYTNLYPDEECTWDVYSNIRGNSHS